MRRWSAVLLGLVVLSVPSPSAAQQAGETVTVVAGSQYEAGGFHRFIFGSAYRDLWTAPIEVPVLDLENEAGGLDPLMVVGRLQTLGLAFRGADGRSYTFRAVHKDLVRILPEELRDTAIADVAQDLLSASVPGSGVVAIPLAVAAGVRQSVPRLVVMPDSPLLREFREQFAGLLGTLAEYPTAASDGGTFGATEIINGTDIFPHITASPANQVDAREFLRARLVDMLLGDWDRHVGQWRFARVEGQRGLLPISEDRDQAFAQYEGVAMAMARDREPKFSDFGPEYQGLEGLGWNARSLDRRLLTGLSRVEWVDVAEDIQRRLTDQAIEDAVRHLPEAYFEIAGETLIEAVVARRDGLVDAAEQQYEFLARQVNVFATDVAELIRIERMAAGTTKISIAAIEGDDAEDCDVPVTAAPHFSRDFRPHETTDLRVYTGDGDDRVLVVGADGNGPRVHLIGGGGSNVLCDLDADRRYVFDMGSVDDRGRGTKIGSRFWLAPSEAIAAAGTPATSQGTALTARRDWGSTSYRLPVFGWGPDLGPVLGYGVVFETYGFRKRPFSTQHQIRAAFAFGAVNGRIDYAGIYRRENTRQFFVLRAIASGIETLRYYGFGNETEEIVDQSFFRIEQTQLAVEGRAAFSAGRSSTFTAGTILRWTRTEEDEDDFIAVDQPYGIEDTGQLGVVAGFNFNNRTRPNQRDLKGSDDALRFGPAPLGKGYTLDVNAHYYPKTGGLRNDYGFVDTEATAAYLLGTRGPAFLFRVGGRTTWGDVPYYDAAFLGSRQLRGLRPNRFAGESSLYGNTAAFLHVGRLTLVVPGRWGVLARGGAGRVWVTDESSDTWHTSYGGGLWWAPWDLQTAVRVEASKSDETTLYYLLIGFGF